jgi:hypothetical protein
VELERVDLGIQWVQCLLGGLHWRMVVFEALDLSNGHFVHSATVFDGNL